MLKKEVPFTKSMLGIFLFICILVFVIEQRMTEIDSINVKMVKSINSQPMKLVALTFDDGPYGTSTTDVLDILKANNINATFFLIGKNVKKEPEIVRRELAEGNVIGNHTYDHTKYLATMNYDQIHSELVNTDIIIASTTGLHPILFRAPYGSLSSSTVNVIKKLQYKISGWTDDPTDWNKNILSQNIDNIVDKELGKSKISIILLHDGRDTELNYPRENMLKALPEIISDLKNRGYTFVTLDRIYGIPAYR